MATVGRRVILFIKKLTTVNNALLLLTHRESQPSAWPLSGLEKEESWLGCQISVVSGVRSVILFLPSSHRTATEYFVGDLMVGGWDRNAFMMESIPNGKQRNICKKDYFT